LLPLLHQVTGDAVDDKLRAVEPCAVNGAVRPQKRDGASGVSRGGVGDGVGAHASVGASDDEAAVYELHAAVEGDVSSPVGCDDGHCTQQHEGSQQRDEYAAHYLPCC
jgi:hypothetical protein